MTDIGGVVADQLFFQVFLEVTQGVLEGAGRVGSKLEQQESAEKQQALEQLAQLDIPS